MAGGPTPPFNGGSGIDNGTNTLSWTGGNLSFIVPASGSYTFPAAGTLVSTTGVGATGTWSISITGTSAGAPPTGSAGGSLTGTYPSPTIANLAITNAMIAASTIDLTAKVTGVLPMTNGGTSSAFFSVAGPTVARTYTFPDANVTIPSSTGTGATGTWGINITGTSAGAPPTGSASGDLSGTFPSPTVSKINGVALGSTTATSGSLLIGSGTQWVTQAIGGDATLSSAGSLIVTKTNGVAFAASATTDTTNASNISSGTLPSGRLTGTYSINISGNSATVTTNANLTGDVTSIGNATTLATVNSNVGTFGSATQVSVPTVNAKGLITAISNITISGVSPGGSASGDLSGTYPGPTVSKINGNPVITTTPTLGNFLMGNGTSWNSQTLTTLTSLTGALGSPNSFTLTGVSGATYAQGKLVYDTDNQSLTFFNDNSGLSLKIGQQQLIRVRNITGSTITKGQVVYLINASSNEPQVALARSNSFSTSAAAGLMLADCANNTVGYVVQSGLFAGIDTTAFAAGTQLYVSSSSAGVLTSTAPTSTSYVVPVGVVGIVHATNGTININLSYPVLGIGAANTVLGINTSGLGQEWKALTGTANQVIITPTSGVLTFTLPQSIATSSSPQFATMGLGDAATSPYILYVKGPGSATLASGNLAYFGSSVAATNANIYAITIDKAGVESVLIGVNKNSATGGVSSNGVFFSTYTATGTISFGRGNGAGLPSNADLQIGSSGQINIPNLSASSLVATDGSKNLTSTTTSLSPTFASLTLSAGSAGLQVTATTNGADSFVKINRADTTGFARLFYQTAAANKWTVGLRDSGGDYKIQDEVNGLTILSVGAGSGTSSLTAAAGDLQSGGNMIVNTAGKGLSVKEGSNAKQGTATLVAGTVVVNNTSVTASSRIQLTPQNSSGTASYVWVSARSAGTSFTISSGSAADTRLIAYEIFEPA